jgi:hypothetical protein
MPGIGSACTPLRSVWHLPFRLLLAMRPMLIDKPAEMLYGQPIRKELQCSLILSDSHELMRDLQLNWFMSYEKLQQINSNLYN